MIKTAGHTVVLVHFYLVSRDVYHVDQPVVIVDGVPDLDAGFWNLRLNCPMVDDGVHARHVCQHANQSLDAE